MSLSEVDESFAVSTCVFAIVTFLVTLSVLFEKGKEAILEELNENLHPVLDTFFGEMTLLGFIGLVFFFINKLELLNGISKNVFGEEDTLNELFETVHMILFLVMMIFLVQILLQLKIASVLEKKWSSYEHHLLTRRQSKDKSEIEEIGLLHYEQLRKQFIDAEPDEKAREDAEDFDFAEYLTLMISDDLSELVEVPALAWGVLWVSLFILLLYLHFVIYIVYPPLHILLYIHISNSIPFYNSLTCHLTS